MGIDLQLAARVHGGMENFGSVYFLPTSLTATESLQSAAAAVQSKANQFERYTVLFNYRIHSGPPFHLGFILTRVGRAAGPLEAWFSAVPSSLAG